MSNDQSKCPGHDRPECVSCCWPKSQDELKPQYTAVDMTTAAADGFRDGQASVVVELPVINDKEWANTHAEREAMRHAIRMCGRAVIAAGGRVKDASPVEYKFESKQGCTCSQDLRAQGKPYPRTCQVHGLRCGVKP